jgi:hypothetical protein
MWTWQLLLLKMWQDISVIYFFREKMAWYKSVVLVLQIYSIIWNFQFSKLQKYHINSKANTILVDIVDK